jgi:hypothetical protein
MNKAAENKGYCIPSSFGVIKDREGCIGRGHDYKHDNRLVPHLLI